MGIPSKIVTIRDGKVNTIYSTIDNELDNAGIKFLAMSVYCRESLHNLIKLGQQGFKLYGLGCKFPIDNEFVSVKDCDLINENRFGFGSISNFIKTGINEELDSYALKNYYMPFLPITANYSMPDNAEKEKKGSIKTETENASYYTYIIDFDSELVRLCRCDDGEFKFLIDYSFLELDICKNSISNEKNMLRRLLNDKFCQNDLETYNEEVEQLKKCGAEDSKNFKEIIKNSIYIFNESYKPSVILTLIESMNFDEL